MSTIKLTLELKYNPHEIDKDEIPQAVTDILEAHEWQVVECEETEE